MKALLTIAALAALVAVGVFACPKKVPAPNVAEDAAEPEDASVMVMDAVVIDVGATAVVSDGSRPD